ncbi:hypothetical protein ACFXG4_27225 [Nocardia sp. NPDC059246]|uniref:hypothetical protein n=1 Tax=unclassified Nocardia TaxID=2637762 RepID=UPI00367632A5
MTVQVDTPQISLNAPSMLVTGISAAASALTLTVPAPNNATLAVSRQSVITGIVLSASGAASGVITVTIADGATTILQLDLQLAIATPVTIPLPADIAITLGNAATVTVSAGATSCVVKGTVSYTYV